MDIPLALEKLGLTGQDWGPGGTSSSTYEDLVRGWRGVKPVPSRSEMKAAWAALQSELAADEIKEKRREEYPPIEEQVEAIVNYLILLKTQGQDLGPARSVVEKIEAVNSKYPPP